MTPTETAQSGSNLVWHAHDGREDLPLLLNSDTAVEIERRDGSVESGQAGYWHSDLRHLNSWLHNGGNCDIVRFRVAQ